MDSDECMDGVEDLQIDERVGAQMRLWVFD